MSEGKIIIRCDGGRSIGLGHVVRCLALADMLRNDFEISFALQETSKEVYSLIRKGGFQWHVLPPTQNFDQDLNSFIQILDPENIVVLDGYEFRSVYQKRIKDLGCKLVSIDDLHAWHQYSDIVINHAGGVEEEDYDCEVYTRLLLGYQYALVRKEFRQYQGEIRKVDGIHNVFISMGAADEPGNTLKFANALLLTPGVKRISIMLSSINPHLSEITELFNRNSERIRLHFNISEHELIEILEVTDLAICPASTIALESSFIRCPLLVGYTAENQLSNYSGMVKKNLAFPIGDMNLVQSAEIIETIEKINISIFAIESQRNNQRQSFTSGNELKIVETIKRIVDPK